MIVLSDHSFHHPHYLFDRLKKESGYFNRQRQTLAGLLAGKDQSLKEWLEWGKIRMDPADVADVTSLPFAAGRSARWSSPTTG